MKNQIKTVLLLTTLSALFLLIGYSIGGRSGVMGALVMSAVMNFGAYWFSDKLVLTMHRAQPIGPGHASRVYEIVQELCQQAKLPMPKVYVVPESVPNAFATGRNPQNAAVAVTDGILRILDENELRGVLAHEISHIDNRDILVSTIVASIASAIMFLAHMMQWVGLTGGHRDSENRGGVHPHAMLFTIILAPLVATLVQTAISRTREFMADESGARLSEDPAGLASALMKISDPKLLSRSHGAAAPSDMQPAYAHIYIVNHFSGGSVMNWFSTHPPVKERVKRLLALKGNG